MLWYDSFSNKNSNFFKTANSKQLYKNKKTLRNNLLTYLIPSQWELLIIYNFSKKKTYFRLYSNVYYFLIPLLTSFSEIKFDKNTNQLLILTLHSNTKLVLVIGLYFYQTLSH
jgi:hypothetical protein